MTTRRPLPVLSPAEVFERQRAAGLDKDNLPLNLTPAERLAAQSPGLPARKPESKMFTVPPALASVAKVVAGLCTMALAATLVMDAFPPVVPFSLWAVGSAAALLAGLPAPSFTPSKPLVTGALVPVFVGLSTALPAYAATLPPGKLQTALLLVAKLASYLVGKAIPLAQDGAAEAVK